MKLSDAEWHIMNALWAQHPATARELIARLPSGVSWAYTTVKTMLTRLVDKKAVKEWKVGPTSVYDPILTRKKARGVALRALVNHAFDGALGPLVHFMVEEQKLSDKQRDELIQSLQKTAEERRSAND